MLSGLAFSARAAWAESPAAPPLNLESRLERLEKLVQEVEEDQNRLNQIAQQIVQGRSGQGGNLGSNSVGRRRKLPPAKDVSGEFEGHRYRFIATPCTWEEAHLAARQEGGHLLVIGSQGEQDFAESLLREAAEGALPPTWIGLVKKGESEWEWVNGEKASFLYWREGEPNNARGNQDRVHLGFSGGGQWNDNRGDVDMYFLVEFPGTGN